MNPDYRRQFAWAALAAGPFALVVGFLHTPAAALAESA